MIPILLILLASTTYANEEATFELPGGATMEMVWIEPGTFVMGLPASDQPDDDTEEPQHEVTISQGVYLGKHELTQGQWESVMGTAPWVGQEWVVANPNHPAVYISWYDVQAFIQQLNDDAGEAMYRLPTEAEWEYACRAGTTTKWPFDSGGDFAAWFPGSTCELSECYGHEVGTLLPNPWGLYDTIGNVLEWCQDWYGPYTADSQIDPQGPATGTHRVVRSFPFNYFAMHDRQVETGSADRRRLSPTYVGEGTGTRLLRMGPKIPTAVTPQTWGQIKDAH